MADLTAQIGLVRSSGPLGWLIRVITRSPVNHVIVALDNTWCIGAEQQGAAIHSIGHFPNAVWSDYALTGKQRAGIVQWCESHEGTPYNWLDDAAIGIALLLHERTPAFIQRRLSSIRTLQCAQLADAAYSLGGDVQLFDDGRLPGEIYPGSYIPAFKNHGWYGKTTTPRP